MLKKKSFTKKIIIRSNGSTLLEIPADIRDELGLKHLDEVELRTVGADRILITKKKKEDKNEN
jgi:antitoxin component of MazEF toxin-antitoxin module